MTKTRAPKPSEAQPLAWGLLLVAVACGRPPPDVAPRTAPSSEPPPRKPDGVVLEPPAAMPSAVTRAEARGVVALRPTLSSEAVRELVASLLGAWSRASLEGLTALLAPDSGPFEARGRGMASLVEGFRQRMRAHEYRRLEGLDLYRPERVEHYAYAELGTSDAPPRPADMRADEVLVRVPLDVTQVAGEKFFENVVLLLVRGEGGHAKIVGYGETP